MRTQTTTLIFALLSLFAFACAQQAEPEPQPRSVVQDTHLLDTPASNEAASQPPVESQPASANPNVDARFVDLLKGIAGEFTNYHHVEARWYWAPEMCAIPPTTTDPVYSVAKEGDHSGKIFRPWVKDDSAYGTYLESRARRGAADDPARSLEHLLSDSQPIGQVIVKDAYYAIPPSGEPHPSGRVHGEPADLFIMTKLDPATEGTDKGWVYGTVTRAGVVTSAGKVGNCMGCHMKCEKDRMFGLAKAKRASLTDAGKK